MNLQEIKEKIQFISISKTDNEKFKGWIMEPEDCFGRGYKEDNPLCIECNIMTKLDNRREMLSVFCREIKPAGKEEKPKSTLQTKLEQLKAFRERKVSNG